MIKVGVEKDIISSLGSTPYIREIAALRPSTVAKTGSIYDRKDRGKDLMQLTTAELHLGSGRILSSLRNCLHYTTQDRKEGGKRRVRVHKIAQPKNNSPLKTSFIVTHIIIPFCISFLLSRVSHFTTTLTVTSE